MNKIRVWRESISMTMGELSRAARIDLVRLSEIERWKGVAATDAELDSLACALEFASHARGLRPPWLLPDHPNSN